MYNHIEVIDKEKCCGCEACVSICPVNCITLLKDKKWFDYPIVDESKCIHCGSCIRVCPFINKYSKKYEPKFCYASKNLIDKERMNSSSGGIFIAMVKEIMKEGGVVVGAVFTDNLQVEHVIAETIEEAYPMMGSKYVQSKINKIFISIKKILESKQKVLFTGTQCQVAGLNHFLGKEYDNLITVELICHGVPSPKVWSDYLNELIFNTDRSKNYKCNKLYHCNFRDKEEGWKKYKLKISINNFGEENFDEKSDCSFLPQNTLNSEYILINEYYGNNNFMKAFLQNYILRPSCYNCMTKSGFSHADITFGDFWGIEEFNGKSEDDKGISAIIIRTQRGINFFNKISLIKSEEASYSKIFSCNNSLEKSVRYPDKYDYFWKTYNKKGLDKTLKLIDSGNLIKFIIRNFKHSIIPILSKFSEKKKYH